MVRWLAIVCLLSSCGSSPTELIVVIDTNLEIPVELDAIDLIVVGPSSRTVTSESLLGADPSRFPLTLGITPESDALGLDIEVLAVGLIDSTEVVRTGARVTLVEGESRTLHLLLLRGCVSRVCAAGETCTAGGCGPFERSDLPRWEGSPPVYVETDPCDSAEWDVDDDLAGAVECGGADCDDMNADIGPTVIEACDGVDNDCDGEADPASCSCTVNGEVQPCVTECGSTGEQTCMDGSFGECGVLPETCNGIDDDCNGSTDDGFDYVPLGEVRLTDDTSDSGPPRVLFTGDRWDLVWADRLPFEGREDQGIFYMSLEPDGSTVRVAPARVGTQGHSPDFAWSGDVFGLSWIDRDSRSECCDATCVAMCDFFDDRLYARTFDATGTPVNDRVRLDSDVSTNPTTRVVWDGTVFTVAFADGENELQQFDTAGQAVPPDEIDIMTPNSGHADFVWTGTHFAAAYANNDNVYFVHDPTTAFLLPEVTVTSARRARTPGLDFTSSGYLLGWYYEEDGGPLDRQIGIDLMSLDEAGTPSGTTINLSQTVGGRGFSRDFPRRPTLRAAPGQVLVTWSDQRDGNLEIYFARVNESGEIIQGATRLTTADGDSDGTSVAWDGEQFGIAWQDERDGNPEIYFNRVGCNPSSP